jgi:hypothetical protein
MGIKHAFTNPKEDSADDTITQPSHWNADHIGSSAIVPPIIQFVGGYQDAPTTNAVTVAVATRALVAVVLSEGRGASSITQTNVTWTQRYTGSAGGLFVEVWTGAIAGAAGTTVTANFASGTKSYFSVAELDVAALTSAGTAATSTTGVLALTGETEGALCIYGNTSFNSNTGFAWSNVPLALGSYSGCLSVGFFYSVRPVVHLWCWQSSGGVSQFGAAMRLS